MIVRDMMHAMIIILVLTPWGVGGQESHALTHRDGLEVEVSLDTVALRLGEQTKLHLMVYGKTRDAIPLLKFAEEIRIQGIEILKVLNTDTLLLPGEDQVKIHIQYLITSFDTGIHEINPMGFIHLPEDDSMSHGNHIQISVAGVVVDPESDIHEIKDIMDTPLRLRDILGRIFFFLLILAILSLSAYFFLRWRKGKPLVPVFKRAEIPAHTLAFKRFEELRMKKLWQQGRIKDFHSELTDILREYIEGRFGIQALEMTTNETLLSLEQHDETHQHTHSIRGILTLADLVKFAREEPLPDEHEKSLQSAMAFVKASIPNLVSANPDDPSTRQASDRAQTQNVEGL